jgi:anti-sigma factor RsiW
MKWRCALLQQRLPEYLDGELPGFWQRRLQTHLEVCPECRQELEALAQVIQALKAAPVADPGPEFWAEFNRELHLKLARTAHAAETAPVPAPFWRFRVPYYLLAAPALAVLLLWAVMHFTSPERPLLLQPQPQMTQAPIPALPAPVAEPAAESFSLATLDDNGEGSDLEEDFTTLDLEPVLTRLTDKEREALLKKLRARERD